MNFYLILKDGLGVEFIAYQSQLMQQ